MTTNVSTEKKTKRRGFTLTEIAIVLGIIGLILGAIWVAASAVYSNFRISTAQRQLVQIAQAVRVLYATAGSVDAGADITMGTPPAATNPYYMANIFPGDMVVLTGTGTAAKANLSDPWGGSVGLKQSAADPAAFYINYGNVAINACISLATTLSGQGINATLNNIGVAAGSATAPGTGAGEATTWPAATAFPITPTVAAGKCVNVSNVMTFSFNLKG
jgi:prepilin-type N-terminal cleavage/methylation domain-containing protein